MTPAVYLRCPTRTPWTLAACAALALTGSACGDDPSSDPEPDASPGDDASSGLDASPGDDSAYLAVTRVRNESGRTIYLSALPSLEPTEIELSEALEMPGRSRGFVFDGSVFAMNSETGEVIRYEVDDGMSFSESGRFSMSGLGITRFASAFAFISPTRAYYIDDGNFQVVVWNPETMEIVDDFDISDLAKDGYPTTYVQAPQVGENRVIAPIGWANFDDDPATINTSVGILVLDAQASELIAIPEDETCALGGGGFFDEEGDFYVLGDTSQGRFQEVGPGGYPPACLLRLPAGETEFDADFSVTMSDLTTSPYFSGLTGSPDRTLLTRGFDPDINLEEFNPEGAGEYFDQAKWLWQFIDLDEETYTTVDLPPHTSSFGPFAVDGTYALPQFNVEDYETTLYIVEDGEPVESVTSPAEIQSFGKIR